MSAPLQSSSSDKPERWINPCGITGHVFTQSDMNGAPDIPVHSIYENIIGSALRARSEGDKAKRTFLDAKFPDPEFEEGTMEYRQDWLPLIPEATEGHFRQMSSDEAFRKSYEYLQYFGVGLEQLLLDQTLHEGTFTTLFKEVENYNTQVLCELQLGMAAMHIQRNDDVWRDVMSQKYRDYTNSKERDMRDFLILRDYVHATNYIAELFGYLKTKL